MNTLLPVLPLPSNQGARKLKMPIRQAMVPRVLRRPTRSASQPESMMAAPARSAPMICTTSTSVMDWSEYMEIQDSGNTVTRWNSAKLASAAKAPIITLRPSLAMRLVTLMGSSSRSCRSWV